MLTNSKCTIIWTHGESAELKPYGIMLEILSVATHDSNATFYTYAQQENKGCNFTKAIAAGKKV